MTPARRMKLANKARAPAEQGDIRAMEFIADRIDGKPAQRQIITGDPDAPVTVVAGPRKQTKRAWWRHLYSVCRWQVRRKTDSPDRRKRSPQASQLRRPY